MLISLYSDLVLDLWQTLNVWSCAMFAVFTCLGKRMLWTCLKVPGFHAAIHTTLSSRARWECSIITAARKFISQH